MRFAGPASVLKGILAKWDCFAGEASRLLRGRIYDRTRDGMKSYCMART